MKQPTTSQLIAPPPPSVTGNGSADTATLVLLAKWRIEDATTDPEQIRAAEREIAEFRKAMNESRCPA
jgi:hypothetical protein